MAKSTIIATTNATGELRRKVSELPAEAVEPEPDPVAVAPAPLVLAPAPPDVVAVAVAVALGALVEVLAPGVPMFIFPVVSSHTPERPENCEALVTAAGVEPQLLYCCRWISLLTRSNTAKDVVSRRS